MILLINTAKYHNFMVSTQKTRSHEKYLHYFIFDLFAGG